MGFKKKLITLKKWLNHKDIGTLYLIFGAFPGQFTVLRAYGVTIIAILLSFDFWLEEIQGIGCGIFYVIYSIAISILLDLRNSKDYFFIIFFGMFLYIQSLIVLSIVEVNEVVITFFIVIFFVGFYLILTTFVKELFYNAIYQWGALILFNLLIFAPLISYSSILDWIIYFFFVIFYLLELWLFKILTSYYKQAFQIILIALFLLNVIVSGVGIMQTSVYGVLLISIGYIKYKFNLQQKFPSMQDGIIIDDHVSKKFSTLEPLSKLVVINSIILIIGLNELGFDFAFKVIWELNVFIMLSVTLILFWFIIRVVIIFHCKLEVSSPTLQMCMTCMSGLAIITIIFLGTHAANCNGGNTEPISLPWREFQQRYSIGYSYDTSAEGALAKAYQMRFPHSDVPTLPNGKVDIDVCQKQLNEKL